MHVGIELEQDGDFPATLAQVEFAQNLKRLLTTPQLWAARQTTLPLEETELRQCKPGELRWLATVSRPDICALLARIASRVNSLRGSDVHRINNLLKTVNEWQRAKILKYRSSSNAEKPGRGLEAGKRDNEVRRFTVRHWPWFVGRMRPMGISPPWGNVV